MIDSLPQTWDWCLRNVNLSALHELCWNISNDTVLVHDISPLPIGGDTGLSVGLCTGFIGCQTKWLFIEEGSNKLCFLLCHTIQYEGRVIKTQGSHKKAKGKNSDLRLHYPVLIPSLSSCGNVIAEAGRRGWSMGFHICLRESHKVCFMGLSLAPFYFSKLKETIWQSHQALILHLSFQTQQQS